MRLSAPGFALPNALLALAVVAAGWSSIVSAFYRIPVEVTLAAIESGQPIDQTDIVDVMAPLENAATDSSEARADLAFTLLASIGTSSEEPVATRAERATRELRAYLSEAPGDSQRWAGLADAELLQSHRLQAVAALKISILTAPGSPLVLWRCGIGIDLYTSLDEDGRRLLAQQFEIAAERSVKSLLALMQQKNAIATAQSLLAGSPEALDKFNAKLEAKP